MADAATQDAVAAADAALAASQTRVAAALYGLSPDDPALAPTEPGISPLQRWRMAGTWDRYEALLALGLTTEDVESLALAVHQANTADLAAIGGEPPSLSVETNLRIFINAAMTLSRGWHDARRHFDNDRGNPFAAVSRTMFLTVWLPVVLHWADTAWGAILEEVPRQSGFRPTASSRHAFVASGVMRQAADWTVAARDARVGALAYAAGLSVEETWQFRGASEHDVARLRLLLDLA